jgi:hypothetical protein
MGLICSCFLVSNPFPSSQLLNLKSSMDAYASLYYFPFAIMLVVNVLGAFVKPKRPPMAAGPGGVPVSGRGKQSSSKADDGSR